MSKSSHSASASRYANALFQLAKEAKVLDSISNDLDKIMENEGGIYPLIPTLARDNSIDRYSYEFEIMESAPIMVSKAEGMVTDFVNSGEFDQQGFEAAWKRAQDHKIVTSIAEQFFTPDELSQNSNIEEALLVAYRYT